MPRVKRTTPIRVTPTEFARRHVVYRLNSTRGLIVMIVASLVNPETGIARTTQRWLAEDMGKSYDTVKRQTRWLLADGSGPVLKKAKGRGYELVGYLAHDPFQCGNVECEAEFTISFAGAVQRAKAAERARRYRAAKKAAQEAASGR